MAMVVIVGTSLLQKMAQFNRYRKHDINVRIQAFWDYPEDISASFFETLLFPNAHGVTPEKILIFMPIRMRTLDFAM
jgi:hypothetical protein